METENEYNVDVIVIESTDEASIPSAEDSAESDLGGGSVDSSVDTVQDREDSSEGTSSMEPASTEIDVNVGVQREAQPNSDEGIEADPRDGDQDSDQGNEEDDFDALFTLTKLLVGGAIEGTSQLTKRLKFYEEELRREAEESAAEGLEIETDEIDEDELTRLRYAMVGLIFEAQASLRKNVTLWAKLADRSLQATNQIAQPVTDSYLFRPFRRRYDRIVRRGEESLARWIAEGRTEEQPSRDLARRTYEQIVGEFIDRLAENPELQAVITKQSIGVASDMRDEVRERTVTADNLLESLVRRVLRRTPRAELPAPPPQIQRWAGLTLEEYKAMKSEADEGKDERTS